MGATFVLLVLPFSLRAARQPDYVSTAGTMLRMSEADGVRYSYDVGGQLHEGKTVRLFARPRYSRGVALTESPGAAWDYARDRWTEGDVIDVYYLPGTPERSALDIDIAPAARWTFMIVPGVIALVFSALVFSIGRESN